MTAGMVCLSLRFYILGVALLRPAPDYQNSTGSLASPTMDMTQQIYTSEDFATLGIQ